MNWSWIDNALPAWQWVLLGLVPPIIFLLYFLKLRRTPVEVPSTYLWTKALEDLHVNSLWQRLRNNLLMYLQLLLALLLLLSCLRPGCKGTELTGERFIFLVDQSASMSAIDTPEGISRLDVAKDETIKLIDQMKSGDSGMVIAFSDVSRTVQSYTTNHTALKSKVRDIEQTQRGSDMMEALTAASGLANPGRTSDRESNRDVQVAEGKPARMFILSDGAIRDVPDFFLGNLTPDYRPIGAVSPPNNVGIVALSISDPLENESQLQCYARLFNSDDEDHTVDVTLKVAGEVFDAEQDVVVPRNNATGLVFDMTNLLDDLDEPRKVELLIETPDVYLQDNTAWAVVNPPREANVLILSDNNEYLDFVLETKRISKLANIFSELPEYKDDPKYKEQTTLGFFDLVIFDRCAPKEMPLCNAVFWGSKPPTDEWKIGELTEPTALIDTDNSHPLMAAVQMGNVSILKSSTVEGPRGSVDLLDGGDGPIMAVGGRGGFQDLVIGFPMLEMNDELDVSVNTDWMTKLSFPLFIQNVVVELGNGKNFAAAIGGSPGEILNFRTSLPFESVTVTSPEGRKSKLAPRPDNTFVLTGTKDSGIYSIQSPDQESPDLLLPINLFDRNESNLTVRDKLVLGYEEVTGEAKREQTRKQYWTWFLLAALVVLMVEWYVYNRRVLI
ncbi:vWA domain-containing protein [Mariniblastus fucicola]|uniref:VWFA domain-containing protein n=1 Tax=Mariniblastus fucicola TaxID=980251 RepID=A0A5B9PDK7_9BACT|nr:BatA and WFA domain-containing protein [Mariniblastus fucicola]QEG23012.1 hypothetical protein MFFC18_29040 [Mariniblastus fucicola]